MTNSKWLSALLAGTALTVASTAAFADTSLITMKRNLAGEGVTFSISPTADMPAAATEVTISGENRSRALYYKPKGDDSATDFDNRTRVFIKGKTETAVGTVGAYVRLQSTDGENVSANKAYGYWQMSPDWQLLAGRTDSIGAIEAGIDWNFNGSLFATIGGPTNTTVQQFRLTYGSGPFTWAVAVEDYKPGTPDYDRTDADSVAAIDEAYAVGSALKFAAGSGVDVSLAGVVAKDEVGVDSDYFVGIGGNFALGSIATATAAVGMGEGYGSASYVGVGVDEQFTNASIGLTFGVSETTNLELGYGYTDADVAGKASDVTAALLWSPVSQLTLGAGVGYESGSATTKNTSAGLGAWFKF